MVFRRWSIRSSFQTIRYHSSHGFIRPGFLFELLAIATIGRADANQQRPASLLGGSLRLPWNGLPSNFFRTRLVDNHQADGHGQSKNQAHSTFIHHDRLLPIDER